MPRVRPIIVAAALVVVGLAVSSARAQDPPVSRHAPGVEVTPSPPASAEHQYGPIRGFFHRHFPQAKKTPRSAHPDWSTGGDAKLSKPWLQPPGR